MTDYVQEQEMEIEALKAILMDEFDVQWGLVFSHAHKYPDEIPLLNLRRCLATHPRIIILMMHWAHCFLIIVYQLAFFNMPITVY
ncbi:putative ubiquitin-conjugating enzyme/RWD [Helianthus anomalus]